MWSGDTREQLWRELRYLQSRLGVGPFGGALRFGERAWGRAQGVAATLAFTVRLGADAMREDLRRLTASLRVGEPSSAPFEALEDRRAE